MIDVVDVSVTVMVDDLERARAFYTGTLGFRELYRAGPHFSMIERSGLKLGLHPRGDGAGEARTTRDVSIGLRVPEIRAAVEALEAEGVVFPRGVVDDDGAILRADFTDPDGTPLYLVETRERR